MIARGSGARVEHLLAERRHPRVPGEAEEEQAGRLQDAVPAGIRHRARFEPGRGEGSAEAHRREHHEQAAEDRDDDDRADPGGAANARHVDGREHDDRGNRDRTRLGRPEIAARDERDRPGGGGLARQEQPARREAPPGAEGRRRCRPTPGGSWRAAPN